MQVAVKTAAGNGVQLAQARIILSSTTNIWTLSKSLNDINWIRGYDELNEPSASCLALGKFVCTLSLTNNTKFHDYLSLWPMTDNFSIPACTGHAQCAGIFVFFSLAWFQEKTLLKTCNIDAGFSCKQCWTCSVLLAIQKWHAGSS